MCVCACVRVRVLLGNIAVCVSVCDRGLMQSVDMCVCVCVCVCVCACV